MVSDTTSLSLTCVLSMLTSSSVMSPGAGNGSAGGGCLSKKQPAKKTLAKTKGWLVRVTALTMVQEPAKSCIIHELVVKKPLMGWFFPIAALALLAAAKPHHGK